MEDGKILKTLRSDQMTNDIMSGFPQGFVLSMNKNSAKSKPESRKRGRPVLKIQNLVQESIRNLSLSLYSSECLILLDLDNSIIPSLITLFRDKKLPEKGSLSLSGYSLLKAGRYFAFIDEKPTRSNLFADMNYLDNLCFMVDNRIPFFWTRRRFQRSIRREYLPLLGPVIDAPSLTDLSLPELYELVYHRILLQNPRLVFCVQPFAGIDMLSAPQDHSAYQYASGEGACRFYSGCQPFRFASGG